MTNREEIERRRTFAIISHPDAGKTLSLIHIFTVTIGDKDYTATLVGEDTTSDIAVIKIDADGLTPATAVSYTHLLTGGLTAAAAGVTTSLVCGVVCSWAGKSHDQN